MLCARARARTQYAKLFQFQTKHLIIMIVCSFVQVIFLIPLSLRIVFISTHTHTCTHSQTHVYVVICLLFAFSSLANSFVCSLQFTHMSSFRCSYIYRLPSTSCNRHTHTLNFYELLLFFQSSHCSLCVCLNSLISFFVLFFKIFISDAYSRKVRERNEWQQPHQRLERRKIRSDGKRMNEQTKKK